MRSLGFLFIPALVFAACSPMAPNPSAAGAATSTVSPAPTPTVVPTPTPVPVGTCPTDSPMTVRQFVEADPSCAIGTDVQIRGWLDKPPAIGFMPPGIQPSWLHWFGGLSVIYEHGPMGADGACETANGRSCAFIFWSIDPASGLDLAEPPRWVIVKGHLDDPAAATCRYVYPEDWTEERADDAGAVQTCRERFVIVEFRDAP